MKNISASIKDRLQNYARENGLQLNPVLERFALSRLFARLSESDFSDKFVLKGAQLFTLWSANPHRPTRDADFLCFGSSSVEKLKETFETISTMPVTPPDGLEWCVTKAAAIREENIYDGVRIKLSAQLGKAIIPVQVDVGFGDAVTPEPRHCMWPGFLNFPATPLIAYEPETVIAEKFHAAVILGTGNSRMKDFYDLLWLSRGMSFDAKVLFSAIEATFSRRDTQLPKDVPTAFTEHFSSRQDKQTQWNAFLRKSQLEAIELDCVIDEIGRFVMPLFESDVSSKSWTPTKGWH